MESLIRDRQIGPLQGFRSKMGSLSLPLRLTPEYKIEFDFGQDKRDGDGALVEMDFTGQEAVGKCLMPESRFRDCDELYLRKATGANRTWRVSCRKSDFATAGGAAPDTKIARDRKTDLLQRFISKKGRPFKAFLVAKMAASALSSSRGLPNQKKRAKANPRSPHRKSTSPVRNQLANVPSAAARYSTRRRGTSAKSRKRKNAPANSRSAKRYWSNQSSGHKRPSSSPKARPISSINSYPKPAGLSRRI